MLRNVVMLSSFIAAAAAFPLYQEVLLGHPAPTVEQPASVEAAPATVTIAPPKPDNTPLGVMKIEMDERGHFVSDFRINGRRVDAMIDTGATVVAINTSLARRAGIALSPGDFTSKVSTANGVVKAANVMLDTVEIGKIRVRGVQAVVLEDDALTGTLIGMNFLKRLKGFEVRGDKMILSQ